MKQEVLREMDALGCDQALRALVEQVPDDVLVLVNPHKDDWLPLAGAPGCVAGAYMNVGHLHLLMEPQAGRALATDTGCRIVKQNQATVYVKVSAEEASDPLRAPRLAQALTQAVRRSATRPGKESVEDVRQFGGSRQQRVCPADNQLVPASGICETHGRVCS